ncbi:MAG: RusA family crossover junction endodeoxyribonuclease [Ruminococcus sp.]|nr:RusA family crossover junction endodeoxyribonuclease [Ruminococcus sp.]
MPMHPPTATHQEKQVAFKEGGKPVFYDPPDVRDARAKLTAHLAKYRPDKPLNCGVRLTVKWCFRDHTGKHKDGEYHTKKPDTDNLIKLLKDCMTVLGFWTDDCRVVSEHCEKFWVTTSPPGIYIKIEELP